MSNGLQTFMKFANLFGNPQVLNGGMPSELPGTQTQLPVPPPQPEPYIDEEVMAQEEPSTLDMFRQSVMNPPQRKQMTYPKSTLNGLTEALKIAAEPSPLAKNRVWVNGQAHQKQQVRIDPVTGEKQFITNVHEPAFMDQVMRAMPAAVSGSVDILNQPHEDAVGDWELKNKGLGAAAKAESEMALAAQRNANAGAIPRKLDQVDRGLDIKLMDAQTRQRLSQLKDLPDSEKMRLLQEGKISLEEIKASNQYTIQELRGEQRTGQIAQQGNIRSGQIAQQGAIRSGQIAQQGNIRSQQIEQQGGIAKDVAGVRGEEARKTKAAPGTAGAGGSSAGNYPTQQRVAMQAKATQIVNDNPEWGEYITFNAEGNPEIEAPSWYGGPTKEEYDKMYEAIYGTQRGGTTAQPPAPTSSIAAPPSKAPGSTKMPPATNKAAPGSSTLVPMTTPDGKGVRMVPEGQVQVALGQGFKYKTARK